MREDIEIEKSKFSELLLNEVNIIVASCDIDGIMTYISPATEKIIGFKTDSLLRDQWWNLTFFSKEESELFKEKVYNILTKKIEIDTNPYDRALRCKDGSIKWIEWRDSIGFNNTLISVGVDITDWKKKEVSKAQSDSILESVVSMIHVCDNFGNVIYVSPSVEKTLGYSNEKIMGKNWWDTTFEYEYDANRVKKLLYNYFNLDKNEGTEFTEQKIKTSSGDYKWIEWQISKGANETYISVGKDITSRILTDLELKKSKDFAEESLKVKNEFLANMSHEIRTPLNAVIGFTDLLLETELTVEQRNYLSTMRNSGEILLSLINNVLDLSKLESEKLDLEEIPFNLHQYVNNIVKLMKIKADEKKISLNLVIKPNTPKQVIGDSTRLGQILLNLIGNAVKFTNEGSVTVTLDQQHETEESSDIYFEVKDTGVGIASNKINTVFGAFTQAKSDTSRIYGGTGLGLTIVKKLIHLLRGKILVESKFGEGSVFKIFLPLKKDTSIINDEESKEVVSMNKPLDLDILLVEDNKTNQFLAKSRLERWNCNVDIANNGIEGVKKAQLKLYDVILMDIQMPIMDGYEATKIIKNDISKKVSEIPIIAMSAYSSKKDIKRALNAGIDDYIFKPFNPIELYKLLEKHGITRKTLSTNENYNVEEKYENIEITNYVDLKFLRDETNNESSLLILLINSFISEIDEFLSVMDSEFKNKNWDELHKATHKIKPSVTMFGISKLAPTIHKLMNKFRNEKQLENVEEIINSCKEIFIKVKFELLTELKSLNNE